MKCRVIDSTTDSFHYVLGNKNKLIAGLDVECKKRSRRDGRSSECVDVGEYLEMSRLC